MRPPAPAMLAVVALFLIPALAAAQCPNTSIEFVPPGVDPVFSDAATRSLFGGVPSGSGPGTGNGRYDLVAGTIHVGSFGDPGGGFGSHVRARDQYMLVGPAGPPIGFSVRLYVSGTAQGRNDGYLPSDQGSVTMSAALLEAGGAVDTSSVTADPGITLPFGPTLEIPLTHAVGDPFDVTFALHSQGGFSSGIADGTISFIMPPGYSIASCQGFGGSGATAAARSTWGSLKLRYR